MDLSQDKLEWSQDKVKSLILSFFENECLWNVALKDYRDRNQRTKAWRKISENLAIPVPEVEKKMHILRTQFNNEHRKVVKSKKSCGDKFCEPYKPSWFGYTMLSFLLDVQSPRKTSTYNLMKSVEDGSQEEEPVATNNIKMEQNNSLENNNIPMFDSSIEQIPKTEQNIASVKLKSIKKSTNYKSSQFKRLKLTTSERNRDSYSLIKILQQHLSQVQHEDDESVFGKHVGNELRHISDYYSKQLAKMKISMILFEARTNRGQFSLNSPNRSHGNINEHPTSPLHVLESCSATYSDSSHGD